MARQKKPEPTFVVRFVGPGITPERVPVRAVSDALSAVQDLAAGRDPFETQQVPAEKAIGLVDVTRGSATYSCFAHSPTEALINLNHIGTLLSAVEKGDDSKIEDERLAAALKPIKSLSEIAKSNNCRLEVAVAARNRPIMFGIESDAFKRISRRLLFTGETTIIGSVQRVGGATGMRCLLRVHGRRRILYCTVKSRDLVRRLGQHLYEDIAAIGTATWIHRTWHVYRFTVADFTQPRLGNVADALAELRKAGLSAWDEIPDPAKYIEEMRQ